MTSDPIKEAEAKGCDASHSCVLQVVKTHAQDQLSYIWLKPKYGKVIRVQFEEPAGSGKWQDYTTYWWTRHSCVISHDPKKLYEEHVKYFIDPKTKSINLKFWFERSDGSVYSMAPIEEFYKLEQEYFLNNGLCTGEEHEESKKNLVVKIEGKGVLNIPPLSALAS